MYESAAVLIKTCFTVHNGVIVYSIVYVMSYFIAMYVTVSANYSYEKPEA